MEIDPARLFPSAAGSLFPPSLADAQPFRNRDQLFSVSWPRHATASGISCKTTGTISFCNIPAMNATDNRTRHEFQFSDSRSLISYWDILGRWAITNTTGDDMQAQTIIHSQGPLPLKGTFTPVEDGPVLFVVTSTAWSTATDNKIGISVSLDGAVIGSVSMLANEKSLHMTLPTLFLNGTIKAIQPQTITLTALGNTATDLNDHFVVQLLV
jgi:hypothetical protein